MSGPREFTTAFRRRVRDTWARIESDEPDISTERLSAMVADECGIDRCDVFEHLEGAPS